MKATNSRKSSHLYFHILPEKLNCAQALLKGFQQEMKISDLEIEEYRAWGGGRAKDGICGALYAAERILSQAKKESVVEEFKKQVGSVDCITLKNGELSCEEYVRMVDELVEARLAE
jgi:hypothetical protein